MSPGPTRWLRRIGQVLLVVATMDVLLFGAAGRLDWLAAWMLSLTYLAFLLIALVWAARNAPDLLEERGRMAANVKTWDKIVVEGGPYRFVRHPMYAGIMLLVICVSLALGSWYALVPAGLVSALYIIRTALEDRMLQDELPGYREYASRVRYRLLPRLW